MGAAGWIFSVVIALLTGAVLELNKNTLLGWILFLAVTAALIFFGVRYTDCFNWWKKLLSILLYLVLCFAVIFISWPPIRQVPASDVNNSVKTDVYSTQYGDVRGVTLRSGVELFAGIPYAKPPVGNLRWKKPQDPDAWTSVRECDTFAPMSMQVQNLPIYNSLAQIIGYHDYEVSFSDNYREACSEDSLYLNIWKPSGKVENAPVAVYIHGGSLKTGQPWYKDYSGEGFAKDGVITVNMGYRLGVFGYLTVQEMLDEEGTAGNFGLLDQIKALQWVKDNIINFGGDPDNITLIGESAGAVCVDALCVSELSKGLFNRVILESSTVSSVSPPHSYRLFDEALSSGDELMERYNCSSLDELRNIPAEKLVGEQESQHHITLDGYVLSDTPYNLRKKGIHNEEAAVHGYNSRESGPFIIFDYTNLSNYEDKLRQWAGDDADEILKLFSPSTDKEADEYWAKIYGAVFFNYPHYCLNRLEQENGVPSWEYLFTKDNKRLGSWHSGELVYTFGVIPDESDLYTDEDRKLSNVMHSYWLNFIINGDPNSDTLSGFEQSEDSVSVMEFGDNTGMIAEPDIALYELFDNIYGWNQG